MYSLLTQMVCVCSVSVASSSTAWSDHRLVDYGWRIEHEGAVRLLSDLEITDESDRRTALLLWQEYDESLERERVAADRRAAEFRLDLIHDLAGPELDESFDISQFSAEEQDRIERMRALFRKGINPFLTDVRFLDPWEEFGEKLGRAASAHEELRSDEFVSDCVLFADIDDLAPVEARARRRLAINAHSLLRLDTSPRRAGDTDPVWKLDILELLEDATKPGEELDWARAIIVDPQAAVAEHDGAIGDLAALIEEFEIEFARLVELFEKSRLEWSVRYLRVANKGRRNAATSLRNQDNARRNEILSRRRQFAEDVGGILGKIDEELRSRWRKRYQSADCPTLFSDDSVDLVVGRLMALADLREEERDAIKGIHALYNTERESLRSRAYDLELRAYCDRKIPRSPESRWARQLRGLSQSRAELAERTVQQITGIVDRSRWPMIEEVIAAYPERVRR